MLASVVIGTALAVTVSSQTWPEQPAEPFVPGIESATQLAESSAKRAEAEQARLAMLATRRAEMERPGSHPLLVDLECERWKVGDSFDDALKRYPPRPNPEDGHFYTSWGQNGRYSWIRVMGPLAGAGWEIVARDGRLVAGRWWAGLIPDTENVGSNNWARYYFTTLTPEEWKEYAHHRLLASWEKEEREEAPLRAVVGVPATIDWVP